MSARRYTPAVLAALAPRITSRDRHVLRLVWEHRVLTAPQIAQIAFDSDDTARKRMLRLHEMSVV
ncbi:replication-relaxation family protein, partial [Spirillospora sp. NPDC052269]